MNKDIIKNVRRCFAGAVLTAAAAGFMTAAASAEKIDLSKTGSITVTYVSGSGEAITDGEFTLYQVAVITTDGSYLYYTYDGDFYYCTEDLNGDLDSELAMTLAEYAEENNASGTVKSLNSNGTLTFEDLKLGLYLIVQTTASTGYYAADPFLVSVPLYQNDEWVYDVDASPKIESGSEVTTESGGGGGGSETTTETTTEGSETTTESSGGGGGGGDDDDDDDDDPTPSGGGGGGGSSYPIGGGETTPSGSSSGSTYVPDASNDDVTDDETDEEETEIEPQDDITIVPSDGGAEIVPEELPQTGQNNLPVPVLALSGLCLFSLGYKMYFSGGGKNNEP